jgi:hypothetical protein
MKQKSIKSAFYGFIAGIAVTLVCLLLIFFALGAVGVASPMFPVIAGIFVPLGASIGYKLGLEESGSSIYIPIPAYIAGNLTFVALNILYSARSFYLGWVVFILTLSLLFIYVLPSKSSIKRYEVARGVILRNYILFGLTMAVIGGIFTWDAAIFTACVLLTLLSSAVIYWRLKPVKPILREKEIPPPSLDIKAENMPVAPKKQRKFLIPAAFVFIIFGTAGYFAYPLLSSVYSFSVLFATAALLSFSFGSILFFERKKC